MLDTHVLIWWLGDKSLSTRAAAAIRSPRNQAFVSAASIWEAEVKLSQAKLEVERDLALETERHGFAPLHITFPHAHEAAHLPYHHGDPFDRMLIAQTRLEGLTLVSRDSSFQAYDVRVLAA